MDRADLLLEIGSEEIPAGYLPPAAKRLRQKLLGLLRDNGLEFDESGVAVYATPRRIAILVPALATAQPTRRELKLGPAVAAAFDTAPVVRARCSAVSMGPKSLPEKMIRKTKKIASIG